VRRAGFARALLRGPAQVEEAQVNIAFRTIKRGSGPLDHPWALTLDTVRVNRLEVTRNEGQILYRRTEVAVEPLVAPLLFEMRAGLLTSVSYAGWARTKQIHLKLGPNGRDVLPDLFGDASRVPDAPPR